ncbi:MAG: substrate-binding periplasmic protein [Leptolyngbyaceae cyanobacterium]
MLSQPALANPAPILHSGSEDEPTPRTEMPPDIQRILDRGTLVVALLDDDNPPFFIGEAKALAGLDIKIAQGLADALEVDLKFNRSAETFNEVVEKVYQLEADIAISKLSRTLSRAKRVHFSHPYVTMRQGLLVNRLQLAQQTDGNHIIEAIRNFNGNVGVIEGSSYGSFIKQKFPAATIQEYPTWDDIVAAVVNGDIQAAYRDELEIKKVILKNPDAALRLQTIALTDTQDKIAMALPWDSHNLQAFVNQYLDTFKLDYTADDVLGEYADYLQE